MPNGKDGTEKEQNLNLPESINIGKEEAKQQIISAFELNPTLDIEGWRTVPWDLAVNYKNQDSRWREGDYVDLCIYYDQISKRILISQIYLGVKGIYLDVKGEDKYPFRISLDPKSDLKSPAYYYTAKPENWYEDPRGFITDCEFQRKRSKGLKSRRETTLRAVEEYTRLFILYQRYFVDDNEGLGIPRNRLRGEKLAPQFLQYHIITLKMLEEIRDGKRPCRLYKSKSGMLSMYDHYPYIEHKVHM